MSWWSLFEGRRARRRRTLLQRAPRGPLRQHLAVPWPERSVDVDDVPLVALDLETTGLDPECDQIVSAGWVRVDRGRIVLSSARHRAVRPEGSMTASSVVIHGISDDRAASGEPLASVLEELLPSLAGAVLVAHHARLDAAFLESACLRCYGARWAGPGIDTLTLLEGMMRRRQQPVPPHGLRLREARRRHGLPTYPEHDALWDAIAAAELWLALAADLRGNGSLPLGRVLQILP